MPRVPPVTGKSDVPAEYHAVVDDVVGVFGQIRGPFSMLLHSPKLAEKMLGLVKFNRDESIVEPQLRSLAHPGVGARARRGLCLGRAGRRGSAGRCARGDDRSPARQGRSGETLADDERDIVTYVRQLVRSNRVDQPVFDALQKSAWRAMARRVDRHRPLFWGAVRGGERLRGAGAARWRQAAGLMQGEMQKNPLPH